MARQRFDQGEFVKAAELLETAFELAPQPEILFNLARARERGGQLDAAVASLTASFHLRDGGAHLIESCPDDDVIDGFLARWR